MSGFFSASVETAEFEQDRFLDHGLENGSHLCRSMKSPKLFMLFNNFFRNGMKSL